MKLKGKTGGGDGGYRGEEENEGRFNQKSLYEYARFSN